MAASRSGESSPRDLCDSPALCSPAPIVAEAEDDRPVTLDPPSRETHPM